MMFMLSIQKQSFSLLLWFLLSLSISRSLLVAQPSDQYCNHITIFLLIEIHRNTVIQLIFLACLNLNFNVSCHFSTSKAILLFQYVFYSNIIAAFMPSTYWRTYWHTYINIISELLSVPNTNGVLPEGWINLGHFFVANDGHCASSAYMP